MTILSFETDAEVCFLWMSTRMVFWLQMQVGADPAVGLEGLEPLLLLEIPLSPPTPLLQI